MLQLESGHVDTYSWKGMLCGSPAPPPAKMPSAPSLLTTLYFVKAPSASRLKSASSSDMPTLKSQARYSISLLVLPTTMVFFRFTFCQVALLRPTLGTKIQSAQPAE